jgi:hypothetical protein
MLDYGKLTTTCLGVLLLIRLVVSVQLPLPLLSRQLIFFVIHNIRHPLINHRLDQPFRIFRQKLRYPILLGLGINQAVYLSKEQVQTFPTLDTRR